MQFGRGTTGDEGFTFIELLVVIVVIGILAAIAIPTFVDQREVGREASAQSDIRNAVSADLNYFVENDAYTKNANQLATHGFVQSSDVDIWFGGTNGGTRFRVQAQHCSGGDRFRFFTDGANQIERIKRKNNRPAC